MGSSDAEMVSRRDWPSGEAFGSWAFTKGSCKGITPQGTEGVVEVRACRILVEGLEVEYSGWCVSIRGGASRPDVLAGSRERMAPLVASVGRSAEFRATKAEFRPTLHTYRELDSGIPRENQTCKEMYKYIQVP